MPEVSQGEVGYLEAAVDSKGEEENSGVGAIKKGAVENSEVVAIHWEVEAAVAILQGEEEGAAVHQAGVEEEVVLQGEEEAVACS